LAFVSNAFQIRLATAADLELISWHRARMFRDMGELPPELFETFRIQSREKLHQMFKRDEYIGWLVSLANDPTCIVAGAGAQLREVPPHPQPNANGKVDIVSGRQAIIQNVYTEREGMAPARLSRTLNKEDYQMVARRRYPFARAPRIR
jgi:hypothetical protein